MTTAQEIQRIKDELIRDATTPFKAGAKSIWRKRLDAYVNAVIGEDIELRARADMLEPTYHRVKGINQEHAAQRHRAGLPPSS